MSLPEPRMLQESMWEKGAGAEGEERMCGQSELDV